MSQDMLPSTLYITYVTYAPAKLVAATPNCLGGDSFSRKYILWPWVQGHTKILTHAAAKFEVTTSNRLMGDAFTEN